MRIFLLFMLSFCSFLRGDEINTVFHKTVGQIEAYKDTNSLHLPIGCVRRLTKNLLTPIHKRKQRVHTSKQHLLLKKTSTGPLTVRFLLPLTLKKEILSLLAQQKITVSIPLSDKNEIASNTVEIDRYATAPKGLFAMKCKIESPHLCPSEVVFIHLLRKP